MTFDKVKLVLREVEDAISPFLKKQSTISHILGGYICFMIAFLGLYLFEFARNDISLMYTPMIIFAVLTTVSIMVYMKSQQKNWNQGRDAAIRIINDYNKIFASKGQYWKIPTQFPTWIELWEGLRGAAHDESAYSVEKQITGVKNGKGPYEHLLATSAESMI